MGRVGSTVQRGHLSGAPQDAVVVSSVAVAAVAAAAPHISTKQTTKTKR